MTKEEPNLPQGQFLIYADGASQLQVRLDQSANVQFGLRPAVLHSLVKQFSP